MSVLTKQLAIIGAGAAIVSASGLSARADAVEDFYKGKVVNMIVSVQEGAPGTDTVARIVARYMQETMAGKPSIVVRNMPGAGHLRATNFLYSQAPKDGATFGLIWPAYVMHQILDGRSATYDAAKFNYIGSTGLSNATVVVWRPAGIKTIEDAKKREVIMGGTGVGSDTVLYPELLNSTLGTKFKVVMGYKGAADIDLALQRGEIEGRAGAAFSTIQSRNWVSDNLVDILVQIGEKSEPGFEQVPMLTSLAKDEETREMLQIFSHSVALGRPFMAPPDVPAERLAALRAGFRKAVAEPALVAEFEKGRLDLMPMDGERLTALVKSMVNVNESVLTRLKALMNEKNASAK